LHDEEGNLIETVTTGEDAYYKFKADCDKKYALITTHENYKIGTDEVETTSKNGLIKNIRLVSKDVISKGS